MKPDYLTTKVDNQLHLPRRAVWDSITVETPKQQFEHLVGAKKALWQGILIPRSDPSFIFENLRDLEQLTKLYVLQLCHERVVIGVTPAW